MSELDRPPASILAQANHSGAHIEDVRAEFRDKAIASTFFMAKAVIGFKDLTKNTHGPMCAVMESPSTKKLVVIPRDHLKTSVCTIADPVRRIAANPNVRILLGNETATNSSHFLRRIEAVFDNCETFRWLFPDLIQERNRREKWSETEMLVPRTTDNPEATVEAIGVGGAVVSRHYDIIKLDDLVGKEASESADVMKKTIDWYVYTESLLVHPTLSEIHVIGTRWTYSDVIQAILDGEREEYEILLLSAETPPNGLWPERFPLDVLYKIRRKMGSWKYSCQYLNAPHDPEASSFNPSHLRLFKGASNLAEPARFEAFTSKPSEMARFLLVDPAISEEDQACNTAMVVVGYDSLVRKWVLETYANRIQPRDLIDKAFDLYFKWVCEVLVIETNVFQKALKYFMQEKMERDNTFVNIKALRTENKKSKKTRIRGLQPFFEDGSLFVKEDQQELIEEYLAFPTGALVDLLDALSFGPYVWHPPTDDQDEQLEEEEHTYEAVRHGMSEVTGY